MNKIEEWRKIILSINDNTFFDLMRNYLGRIQTPFNKQQLMDRLINFFSRADIQETLISLIDSDDARLLTALSLSGGATESQLRTFFPRWTYLELLNRIGNLEERFLIYRKRGFCCITPLFEEKLEKEIISPSLLIESGESAHGFDPPLWFNDPLVLALYSFLLTEENLIKIDGSVKKRGSERLEQVFPSLFSDEAGQKRFDLALKILINLDLLEKKEGTLTVKNAGWKKLGDRPQTERYCLYYGAALAENKGKSASMTEFFAKFYNNFPTGRFITEDSLNAFFMIFCNGGPGFRPEYVKEVLKELNILVRTEGGLKLNGMLNLHDTPLSTSEPPLIVQPNFEVTVKPIITLGNGLRAAEAMEVKRYDLFSRYGLTRKSFLYAFGRGLSPHDLLEDLQELSGKEIPQNIGVSLKDWADDHEKVTLYKGTIMKVSEDKRRLIEKTGFLDPFIKEVLADGIYLLEPGFERQWMEALENLSITPRIIEGSDVVKDEREVSFPAFDEKPLLPPKGGEQWSAPAKDVEDSESHLIQNLLKELERSAIKGDEKKELEARIRRKLIFHESQLNKGIVRPEITEARGINFQGKVRLVESALQNSSDRLELSYFAGGESISVLVQPLELKKEESERILEGRILPDEEPITIRISKVSRIRKIRSSLF